MNDQHSPLYVLIGGYKRSGKNTVADFLERELPRAVQDAASDEDFSTAQRSFARPLKHLAVALYRWNGEKDSSPLGHYGRALLQTLGDALREVPARTIAQIEANLRAEGQLSEADIPFTARRFYHFAITGEDTLAAGQREVQFDPLIDKVVDDTEGNNVNSVESDGEKFYNLMNGVQSDISIVTDVRMPFEFGRFRDIDAVKVWIDRPGKAKPGAHKTEQLDPRAIPGVQIITNVEGNPYAAGGELLALVMAKLEERGDL